MRNKKSDAENNDGNKNRLIYSWRRDNLRAILEIIDKSDEMNARSILAEIIQHREAIKNASAPLGAYIREDEPEPIKGKWVHYIETAVRDLPGKGIPIPQYYLEESCLDIPTERGVAYVLAAVRLAAWPEISQILKEVEDIKEASLLYGANDYNALIKIESTSLRLNKILLENIISNPEILKTQTLHSVPFSQWQKKQTFYAAELGKLLPHKKDERHGIVRFDSDKFYHSPAIKDLFHQEWQNKRTDLKNINGGTLILKTQARLNAFPAIIAKAANQRIFAVVVWSEVAQGEENRTQSYLSEQAARLRHAIQVGNDVFKIRRIFVLNLAPECFTVDMGLCKRVGQEISIGIEVRYINENDWPALKRKDKPRDFGLVDDFATWQVRDLVNDEGLRQVQLSIDSDDNTRAANDFNQVWDKASQLSDELRALCINAFERIT